MNPVSRLGHVRSDSLAVPVPDKEAQQSPAVSIREPEPLPRPHAPAPGPRASSTQLARFSVTDRDSSSPTTAPKSFQGAWKNAQGDIVSEVASHLNLPDRLALSQSSAAIREAMLLHNDIAVPTSVVKSWNTLQESSNTQALDELFKYIPSASALDKSVLAMEFVKHLDYLQSEAAQPLQQIDHVYNALSVVSSSAPDKAIQLIQGLFDYGIARLPEGRHTSGLERITTAIHGLATERNKLSTLQELADERHKLNMLSDLTSTAIAKFQVMPLNGDDRGRIGKGLLDTINLTQAGRMRHDFALLDCTPDLTLSNAEAEAVLRNVPLLENTHVKLDLINGLITHFDRLKLDDAPKFLAELDVSLRPFYGHGIPADTMSQLLKKV